MDRPTEETEQMESGLQLKCHTCGRRLYGRATLVIPLEDAEYDDQSVFSEGEAIAFDSIHFAAFIEQLFMSEITTVVTIAIGSVGDIISGILGEEDED